MGGALEEMATSGYISSYTSNQQESNRLTILEYKDSLRYPNVAFTER